VAQLDVIESDSDSDEDSVPLATLAKEKGGKLQAAAPSTPAPTNGTANPVDVLGFDPLYPSQPSLALPSPPAELPAVGIAKDAFGVPVADIGSSSLPHPPRPNKDPSPAAAGVNAFDDAMAKLLNNGSVKPASQFTFDSVFDDNFDFASAAEKFPEASNAVNGSEVSSVPAAAPQNDGFNSIFPPPNVDATPSAHLAADASVPFSFDSAFATNDKLPVTQPVAKPSSTQDSLNISFDEAFSGFESPSGLTGESLSGSLAYSAPQAPLPPTPTQSPSTTTNVNPFPAVSPPASPKSVPPPRTSPTRPVSPPPPRQKSPPPRVSKSSRPSTASNKDEKSKDPPPRHSKLSVSILYIFLIVRMSQDYHQIRLPFGRKKKPQESLPPPPVVPQGSSDLALDDDVESVKQICGMGFTRDQAVAALETHGYDTQKAINSLLG
jgi:epidermal growth factor receptor substrate 15